MLTQVFLTNQIPLFGKTPKRIRIMNIIIKAHYSRKIVTYRTDKTFRHQPLNSKALNMLYVQSTN